MNSAIGMENVCPVHKKSDKQIVFLDISKAFDKVWHKGLLYKLTQNGISGKLLSIISNFLSNRKQRVVLNGKFSSWTNVKLVFHRALS